MSKLVTFDEYDNLVATRPLKFDPEEVEYVKAPKGSAIRCAACVHYYRRAVDGLATCEIMRSDETDKEGVEPDYRCHYFTVDGHVFPLVEEE